MIQELFVYQIIYNEILLIMLSCLIKKLGHIKLIKLRNINYTLIRAIYA
jgi:hypothetical protein